MQNIKKLFESVNAKIDICDLLSKHGFDTYNQLKKAITNQILTTHTALARMPHMDDTIVKHDKIASMILYPAFFMKSSSGVFSREIVMKWVTPVLSSQYDVLNADTMYAFHNPVVSHAAYIFKGRNGLWKFTPHEEWHMELTDEVRYKLERGYQDHATLLGIVDCLYPVTVYYNKWSARIVGAEALAIPPSVPADKDEYTGLNFINENEFDGEEELIPLAHDMRLSYMMLRAEKQIDEIVNNVADRMVLTVTAKLKDSEETATLKQVLTEPDGRMKKDIDIEVIISKPDRMKSVAIVGTRSCQTQQYSWEYFEENYETAHFKHVDGGRILDNILVGHIASNPDLDDEAKSFRMDIDAKQYWDGTIALTNYDFAKPYTYYPFGSPHSQHTDFSKQFQEIELTYSKTKDGDLLLKFRGINKDLFERKIDLAEEKYDYDASNHTFIRRESELPHLSLLTMFDKEETIVAMLMSMWTTASSMYESNYPLLYKFKPVDLQVHASSKTSKALIIENYL